jgi:hypothetical protein
VRETGHYWGGASWKGYTETLPLFSGGIVREKEREGGAGMVAGHTPLQQGEQWILAC